jgi:hypothetical protein
MIEHTDVLVRTPEWVRGPVRVVNGEIILQEDKAERYSLDDLDLSERMAFDLAMLPWHRQDPRTARAFARRYGLLWHGADALGSGQCRESLDDWWVASGKLFFVGAFYQNLVESSAAGSAAKLRNFFRMYGTAVRFSGVESDEDYLFWASVLLQNMLNEGLQGAQSGSVTWGVVAVAPGDFRLGQYSPDLLSNAYAAFAGLMANKVKVDTCPGCGCLFRPRSARQKWCTPGCGSTNRGRRRRERQAESP